jgi:hypothetical protein
MNWFDYARHNQDVLGHETPIGDLLPALQPAAQARHDDLVRKTAVASWLANKGCAVFGPCWMGSNHDQRTPLDKMREYADSHDGPDLKRSLFIPE